MMDTEERRKAVALSYKHEQRGAPFVVAKGQGIIAEQIIALAEQSGVHLHESPELIEVLIRLELGEEIPEALYLAVAEVIAFAYGLKQGR